MPELALTVPSLSNGTTISCVAVPALFVKVPVLWKLKRAACRRVAHEVVALGVEGAGVLDLGARPEAKIAAAQVGGAVVLERGVAETAAPPASIVSVAAAAIGVVPEPVWVPPVQARCR